MSAEVRDVCQSTYNTISANSTLSVEARKTVVQVFVFSWLGYCNSVFSSVTDSLAQRQAVQNATACLVIGIRRCEHITPALSYWRLRVCNKLSGAYKADNYFRWGLTCLSFKTPGLRAKRGSLFPPKTVFGIKVVDCVPNVKCIRGPQL